MKDVFWLIRKTAKTVLKDYKNLLIVIALPIIGIVLSTLITGDSGQATIRLGIVSHDGGQQITEDAARFLSRVEHTVISSVSETEADDAVRSGELDAVIIFPEGFAESVSLGEPKAVQLKALEGSEAEGYVKYYLNAHIQALAALGRMAGGDAAVFVGIYGQYQSSDFRLQAKALDDRSADQEAANRSIGYLIVLMLFSAVNLSALTIRDRDNRTYYRLLASPVSSRRYVLSNIIVNIVLMMIQIVATLIVMTRFFHIDPGVPMWQMFLVLSLFALVAVSLSQAIVAFSDSTMAANGIQMMVIMPTSLLAGCMFPLSAMPEAVQRVADFLPQHWLLDTLSKLQQGSGAESILLNVAVLLAFALALGLIAAYKIGRNQDMGSYV